MAVLCVVLAGCFSTVATTGANKTAEDPDKVEPTALEEDQGGAVKPVPFDGKRAMKYLEAICDIGPRMSATPGMTAQIKLVTKHFEDLGLKVEVQAFKAKQVTRQNEVEMKNLIIRFFPENQRRIILCSHYDTRPIADQEEDKRKWHDTFISANDGGSGVAFLMELANHMKGLKTSFGVDFVLFDGEEYIFDSERDKYFIGSKHFAQTYKKEKGKAKYAAAVLLDMIGGKDAQFPYEGNSWLKAKDLCKDIWGVARDLKVNNFKAQEGYTVLDDHTELLAVGIPSIDIIDFDYKHWHRLSDVPANCSGETLENVSKVLSVWLQRVK